MGFVFFSGFDVDATKTQTTRFHRGSTYNGSEPIPSEDRVVCILKHHHTSLGLAVVLERVQDSARDSSVIYCQNT